MYLCDNILIIILMMKLTNLVFNKNINFIGKLLSLLILY